MSQIANITVKNGKNADATFTAYQPQSGSDPALWMLKNAGPRYTWSRMSLSVRRSQGANPGVRHKLGFNIPVLNALGERIGSIPFSGELTLPDTCTQDDLDNAAAYIANCYSSALIKETITTGSPAI